MKISSAIAAFEKAFFWDSGESNGKMLKKSTWTGAYLPYLRVLDSLAGSEPICVDLLSKALAQYNAGTRSYQICRQVYFQLARSAGLDLPDQWGFIEEAYSDKKGVKDRKPLSDEEIISGIELIANKRWRLVYALMAAYGLRNYEAFFCDVSQLVDTGTGILTVPEIVNNPARLVLPYMHDWLHVLGVDKLAREKEPLPQICTDLRKTTLQQIGRRSAEQFRRYGCPFAPGDLRHSWAVRAVNVGAPATVVARAMGVDIPLFVKMYRPWVDQKDREYMEALR
jgi:integrase